MTSGDDAALVGRGEMINVAKDDAGCHVEFLNRAASRVDYNTQQSILTTMTMQTTTDNVRKLPHAHFFTLIICHVTCKDITCNLSH